MLNIQLQQKYKSQLEMGAGNIKNMKNSKHEWNSQLLEEKNF